METILYFIPILIVDTIIFSLLWRQEDIVSAIKKNDFNVWFTLHLVVFLVFSVICLMIGLEKVLN